MVCIILWQYDYPMRNISQSTVMVVSNCTKTCTKLCCKCSNFACSGGSVPDNNEWVYDTSPDSSVSILHPLGGSFCSRPQHANSHLQNSMLYWFVGCEINVPFQHKNRLYWEKGLGWRFRSARLRMANDIVTSQPRCLFVNLYSPWNSREKKKRKLYK